MKRVVFLLALLAAGCGGSSSKPASTGDVHPLGAYVAPGCSGAADGRGPQYVVVTNWLKGKLTGNSGRFAVPSCANVIVYLDSDKADVLRVEGLGIATAVKPGTTAQLEFYAPAGTYPVTLRRHGVEVVRVLVAES